MTFTPVIAIDGPAASGKGTLARRVAAHYGFDWLDTGLLYRAVGRAVLDRGQDPADAAHAIKAAADLHDELNARLGDERLRGDEAGNAASKVSVVPEVRTLLLDLQRTFATFPKGGKGAVLDGRDIGTVICPDADVKIYVTARVEIRAQRRWKELLGRAPESIFEAVLQDLQQRDTRDSQRAVAPLKPAEDAFLLDVSDLDADQAFAAALRYIEPMLLQRYSKIAKIL
jgi:cytidylate kinase